MDTESAIRFRQTGRDDAGNLLYRKIADHPAPCRHCLAASEIGTPVLGLPASSVFNAFLRGQNRGQNAFNLLA